MNEPGNAQQALQEAVRHHNAGNLDRAERLYRHVLEQVPGQPDALQYLGVIETQRGRFDSAAELIGRVVADQPGNPYARANLGNALMQGGDAAAAAEQYRAALDIEPDMVDVRRNLALVLLALDRASDALQEIREAARQSPRSLPVLVTLGNILAETGRVDDAVACFERVLAEKPDLAPVHANLGSVLRQAGRLDEAIERYEQAIGLAPDYAEAHYGLGVTLANRGKRDMAGACLRKALEVDPGCSKAWQSLANLGKGGVDDDGLATIEDELARDDRSREQRMHLGFAAGKLREDRGEHDEAFKHFLRANELHREALHYDPEADRRVFDNIRASFDRAFFDRWAGAGSDDSTPIFIVGMPRSGTTLVEQILASHGDVYGAGELSALQTAIASRLGMQRGVDCTAALGTATAEDFEAIADHYLAAIRQLDGKSLRITDKLPMNFLNLGMIAVLFPKATIVHCTRDPRDTCFSIFKHSFTARGHGYAYDLEVLGRFYVRYRELMDHWRNVLPVHPHEVVYEDVVADQEAETRALLEACGLPWDPACLAFHETQRPVATISADQVRRPIYRDSVAAWRRHEAGLAPLLQILDERPTQ